MTDRPVLTIGIPTWNRAPLLGSLLAAVVAQVESASLGDDVEIVVSDNGSTDETMETVSKVRLGTSVSLRYHRNPHNLGVVQNVFQTLRLAEGRFWMFYGDDDVIPDGALVDITATLRRHAHAGLVIFQPATSDRRGWPTARSAEVSVPEMARKYLYHMGNAGLMAVRCSPAQAVLSRLTADDPERLQTWWPSTHIGLLTLGNGGGPPVVAAVVSSHSPHHAENTLYNSWYVCEGMLYALYRIAWDCQPLLGDAFFCAATLNLMSAKRALRLLRNVLVYNALFDRPSDAERTRSAARLAMRDARGARASVVFMAFVALTSLPMPVKRSLVSVLVPLRWPNPSNPNRVALRRRLTLHRIGTARLAAGTGPVRRYGPDDL